MFHVIVGQGRLLTLSQDIAERDRPSPLIATGDPSVIDFDVVGPRQIRVTGQRIGVTDLSLVTAAGESYALEVHVVADLEFLHARLRQAFPDASLKLSHLRQHVIVEGQARDTRQIGQIMHAIEAYLAAVQPSQVSRPAASPTPAGPTLPAAVQPLPSNEVLPEFPPQAEIIPEAARPPMGARTQDAEIINLIRVPGPQQVLLKVQIAELNRTALRQLGVSFLFQDGRTSIGSNISNAIPAERLSPAGSDAGLLGLPDPLVSGSTAFGVFDHGRMNTLLDALRRNQVFKILAEPTLVAMHGQEASFLSGGEFPIPVPQAGAAAGAVTIEYREFGVGLTFLPFILDGDTVRLSVSPEVSSIDFALGIIQAGFQVPALSTRKTQTVVELRQGQTLAISGLLQLELDGSTGRIPGLGDLPHIGAFFRNNSMRRVEKELIVLVTPYLVEPLNADELYPLPGEDLCEPDDRELYLQGRIEGRTGMPFRSTTRWDDPLGIEHRRQLEADYLYGPHGYSP